MARKVFISFLGNGFYEPTQYVENVDDEESTLPLRFIQEATIGKFCKDYTKDDVIYIFTTNGALTNWNDGEHKNFKSNSSEWYEGLQTRLKGLNLICHFENIIIPEGKSTDEIWDIFRIVYEKLEDKDELIFDITHGFRSLPMLNMVLINYAKLLKHIHVKGIHYGAFEAKYSKNELWYSPIWNLKDFVQLQEWTNATSDFIDLGNSQRLENLLKNTNLLNTNLSKKKTNLIKDQLFQFAKSLKELTAIFSTNRGREIINANVMISLSSQIQEMSEISETIAPLAPLVELLRRIESITRRYKTDEVFNGIRAVEWCLRCNLIQQGITLLQEFIVTICLHIIGEAYCETNARLTCSALLGKKEDKAFEFNPKFKELQESLIGKIERLESYAKLKLIYQDLNTNHRNDINHAGFREKPKHAEEFRKCLERNLKNIQTLEPTLLSCSSI